MSAVQLTAELRRIASLPRRNWEEEFTSAMCEVLTAHVRRPGGTMVLNRLQCCALVEIADTGGWFGQAAVGSGKTLVTFLAPVVAKAKRPLLLVPSKLHKKTHLEYHKYSKHFALEPIRIEKYEVLSRVGGGGMLAYRDQESGEMRGYMPDMILLDEVHKCKNVKASCTRKIQAYLRWARSQP